MTKIPNDVDVLRYARSFGRHPTQLLSRETVREVWCPACHADPGSPCSGVSGIRTSNHSERCFERVRIQMLGEHRMSDTSFFSSTRR